MTRRVTVRVTGTVQGVGFRPFVFSLATELGITGFVGNDVDGVFIEAQGDRLDTFLARLVSHAPPMATIEDLQVVDIRPHNQSVGGDESGFSIRDSVNSTGAASASIPPDTAVCRDCLAEMRDPGDRRYGYAFIACTNCGPRYTMVRGLPYDRDNTAMAEFPLCNACTAEYRDPNSRRYHAQPTACPECGPQLSKAVVDIVAALDDGLIVAIKGVGGYHLACDARNPVAVATLRERKRRGDKPFAVMVANIAAAAEIADISGADNLLESSARPIVLLPTADGDVSAAVAPGNNFLGVMLAYTPMHHLLFDAGAPPVLVMTSGNLSDETICTDAAEAELRLANLADVFCHHDREICVPCDDSVVRATGQLLTPVRRGRGYAPQPLPLPVQCGPMVAVGAEIKATAAIANGRRVWLTQHVGDVENLETLRVLRRSIEILCDLQRVHPELVVSDAHPGYLSRRWAEELARESKADHVVVQHHHAHLASLLAEHRYPTDQAVLGFVFDGTGYGTDGTIWGGEMLLGSYGQVTRTGHLRPVQLPGGDAAIRFPARVALSHALAAGVAVEETASASAMAPSEVTLVGAMLSSGSHCTPTSSMGRLFDAIASLLDVRHSVDYEAQAAMELEAIAESVTTDEVWPSMVADEDDNIVIDPAGWVRAAALAFRQGDPVAAAARAFHNGVAHAVAGAAMRVREVNGVDTVGLTGGVFANALLVRTCTDQLQARGFTVLTHRMVPPNDGGLALGQVCVAALGGATKVG